MLGPSHPVKYCEPGSLFMHNIIISTTTTLKNHKQTNKQKPLKQQHTVEWLLSMWPNVLGCEETGSVQSSAHRGSSSCKRISIDWFFSSWWRGLSARLLLLKCLYATLACNVFQVSWKTFQTGTKRRTKPMCDLHKHVWKPSVLSVDCAQFNTLFPLLRWLM